MAAPMVIIDEGAKLPKGNFYNWIKEQIKAQRLNIKFSLCEGKYVSNSITKEVVRSWKPYIPIIISSQTGTGKNTFILETLFPFMEEYGGKNDRILILTNRIALNRQIKLSYQEILKATPEGLNKLKTVKERLTQEGMDSLFTDFGPFTICTYHQALEKKLLDSQSYKYIICDEFHFFTSDATFNDATDKILNEIVNKGFGAIRIYMSATPEVAIEAVIRAEFNWIEIKRSEVLGGNDLLLKKADEVVKWNMPMGTPEYNRRIKEFEQYYLTQYTTYSKLEIFYYHFNRDYTCLDEIYSYNSLNDLLPAISNSEEKWIIFVSSEKDGIKLSSAICKDENKRNCVVLSRKIVDAGKFFVSDDDDFQDDKKEETAKKEYQNIIENGKFDSKVLITTSLLDNGINIKDESVSNIVIDKFDRTEFVQMLGRVRINGANNKKLRLFIHDFSKEDLISNIKQTAKNMIEMIYNDLLSYDNREKYYSKEKHLRMASKDKISEQYSDYNPYALMSFIDTIGQMMKTIKKIDPEYFVDIGPETNAKRNALLNYYIKGDGWNFPWARSIVDIFETPDELKLRNEHENKDLKYGNTHNDYSYSYDNGFMKFLYEDGIIESLETQYKVKLNEIISRCDENDQRALNARELVYKKRNGRQFTMYEKADVLSTVLENSVISLNKRPLKKLEQQIKQYKKLVSWKSKIHDAIEMQLSWIERFNESVQSVEELNSEKADTNIGEKDVFYNRFIDNKAFTIDELNEHKTNAESPTYETEFLKKHAINIQSPEWNECTSILKINRFKKGIFYEYNNTKYTLISVLANRSENRTFYLWIIDN